MNDKRKKLLYSGLERREWALKIDPKLNEKKCHHQLDESHEGSILAEVPGRADSLQCFGGGGREKAFLGIQESIEQLPIGSCLSAGDSAVARETQTWMVSRHC